MFLRKIAKLSGGYSVSNSLRFRSSASAYLNRTPSVAGNTLTWTWSGWIKRGTLTTEGTLIGAGVSAAGRTLIYIDSTDHLVVSAIDSSITRTLLVTNAVYRDPSAWYHVVVAYDETNGTSSNRVKLYVNGQQVTAFSTATYPPGSAGTYMNSANAHAIGRSPYTSASYFDAYIAETVMVDGQALTPSSFGTYDANGVWQPIKYSGTYGTNGFYLPFTNTTSTATLGNDFSGNGNTWTVNNVSLTAGSTYDSMIDSPTLTSATVANYAVWNPINSNGGTFSNANLQFIGASAWKWALSTFQIPSNVNVYAEATLIGTPFNNTDSGVYAAFGIVPFNWQTTNPTTTPLAAGGLWINDTGFVHNNNATGTNTGSAFALNDVIGLAFNPSTGAYTFYKNGASISSGTFSLTGPFCFANSSYSSAYGQMAVNFGQRPFSYTPPTGFNALNTYNLPTPTIANGAQYMAATLYTGTNANLSVNNGTNTAIGTTFQPDFLWIKQRSAASSNLLFDSTRGVTHPLWSDLTAAEGTATAGTGLTSLNTNGWTLGTDISTAGSTNINGNTYVGWQWKANGTGVSNTSGSITSTVSANTTAGFSVVTFTAPASGNFTVGHGLNASPAMMILKDRSAVVSWTVWHKSLSNPAQSYLALSNTNAVGANTTVWGNTAPTSTVMTLGVGGAMNASDATVAYCFSEVAGYSAFESYTGNGLADGPFVYTGFRPRFVMVKRTDSTGNWQMLDTSRLGYNSSNYSLFANLTNAESYNVVTDILSNGFKIRDTGTDVNASGGTYIYAAFAENPFQNSRAR